MKATVVCFIVCLCMLGVEANAVGFLLDSTCQYLPADNDQIKPAIACGTKGFLTLWEDGRDKVSKHIFGARVDTLGNVLDSASLLVSYNLDWQILPALVYNTQQYFAVWSDHRDTRWDDIYGCRILEDGSVIDTNGIKIIDDSDYKYNIAITTDSINYLLVWSGGNYHSPSIYAARVNQQGVLLDTNYILVSEGSLSNGYDHPSVSFDGTNFLVVWEKYTAYSSTGYDIYAKRIDRQGHVLDSLPMMISAHSEHEESRPQCIFGDSSYIVVWQENSDGTNNIHGARVSCAGIVLDTISFTVSDAGGEQKNPSVCFTDSVFLVVWDDTRNDTLSSIYGARVNQKGVVTDLNGFKISNSAGAQEYPKIIFNGTKSYVAWQDKSCSMYDIRSTLINDGTTVSDTLGSILSLSAQSQDYSAPSYGNGNYMTVWQQWNGNSYDIYGAMVSSGGIIQTQPIKVSINPGDQIKPAINYTGVNHFVVWCDNNNSDIYKLYGARINDQGILLDTISRRFDSSEKNKIAPALACKNDTCLLVWREDTVNNSRLRYRLINTNELSQSTPEILAANDVNSYSDHSVCYGDGKYFLTWEDKGYFVLSMYWCDLYGKRIDEHGAILDTLAVDMHTATQSTSPCVVYRDTSYWSVLAEENSVSLISIKSYDNTLHGYYLTMNGFSNRNACLSFNGNCFLSGWREYRYGWYNIYGSYFDTSGTNEAAISNGSKHQINPAMSKYSADGFYVTYTGWCDSIGDKPANCMRIWGVKLNDPTGVAVITYNKEPTKFHVTFSPNPVNNVLKIAYSCTDMNKINIDLFNICGQLVKRVQETPKSIGMHRLNINCNGLANGVYICRLSSKSNQYINKITIIR